MYYQAEKIYDSMTAIRSKTGEILYLIEGEKQAVLVDAGLGVGHLREFVAQLTDKPLTVLLTHGHVDHAPGVAEFDKVYLNSKDLYLYRRHCMMEERKGYLKACLGTAFDELTEEDFVPSARDKVFAELCGGMVFDLGGIHLRTISFPGHTPGGMVFLLEEPRCLILGDACNDSTFLFAMEAATVESYRKTVRQVSQQLKGSFDRVFISHHNIETDKDIMDNMLTVCDDILAGRADDLQYHFRGMEAWIAKRCSKHFVREDGKSGNLIYNKDKMWDAQVGSRC